MEDNITNESVTYVINVPDTFTLTAEQYNTITSAQVQTNATLETMSDNVMFLTFAVICLVVLEFRRILKGIGRKGVSTNV